MFKNYVSHVKSCTISFINISDHAAVSLKITKGKTIWRLNNSLLQDKKFVEKMQKIIIEYVEINDTEKIDPIILWEGAEAVMTGHIISYASAKKKGQRNTTGKK